MMGRKGFQPTKAPWKWKQVSFAADCLGGDGQELGDICSLCGDDYAECGCPGPTQDKHEYKEVGGVLYARRTSSDSDGY